MPFLKVSPAIKINSGTLEVHEFDVVEVCSFVIVIRDHNHFQFILTCSTISRMRSVR